MTIPLEEGFTVVTGPNGSGKSNILDGILFCLGLASSRGMRAERLTDLVNSSVLKAGKSAETVVSVRFDLDGWEPDLAEDGLEIPEEGPWIKPGQKEWTVTRRLRVMPGGSYSSSYTADGEGCNLQQLQIQLRRLRIDPEGSNVVMQGDVTRVVSMSNKDRRGLIDELAGVALFDNRIDQAKQKLDDVFDRQERCRIVEQELLSSKQRLEKDCEKARLYKTLKDQMKVGREQESVLNFENAKQDLTNLKLHQKTILEKEVLDQKILLECKLKVTEADKKLKKLQSEVKALGEDKLIKIQGDIAGLQTKSRELNRQAIFHKQEGEKLKEKRQHLQLEQQNIKQNFLNNDGNILNQKIELAEKKSKESQASVEVSRRRLTDVAGRSGEWVEEYKERSFNRQNLQNKLTPLQEEQQKLKERLLQINERLEELTLDKDRDILENKKLNDALKILENEWSSVLKVISAMESDIAGLMSELDLHKKTRIRLENDQYKLEKEIARLESRRETLQESRGTGALRLLLESGLEGIHGPVANLGEVEQHNRLALEVAAGGRIGHIVVEDDVIASKAIEILKKRKAGRLTFLPLNKIKSTASKNKNVFQRPDSHERAYGFIGRAFDLIKFENIYNEVFRYVFGDTIVFNNLQSARSQLGISRSVTLAGELIEKSGAITGGSLIGRSSSLSFGSTAEKDDIEPLRHRLLELGETLVKVKIEENRLIKKLDRLQPELKKAENMKASLDAQRVSFARSNGPFLERQSEHEDRFNSLNKSKDEHTNRLKLIELEIQPFVIKLKAIDTKEKDPISKGVNSNIAKLQDDLKVSEDLYARDKEILDNLINEKRHEELALERFNGQQKVLIQEEESLQDSINLLTKQHQKWREENKQLLTELEQLEILKKDLETSFGKKRHERDAAEQELSILRQKSQDLEWKLERLRDDLKSIAEELRSSQIRIQELEKCLPDPYPEISVEIREKGLDRYDNGNE